MKITIYELLGMIKDNKAPKKILFDGDTYTYCENVKDYANDEVDNYSIFEDMVISRILNDEVEIIEDNKIEKLHFADNVSDLTLEELIHNINFTGREITNKINEIIDYIKKEK